MPFVSKAHARYMFARHPEIAKEWVEKYHKGKGKKRIKFLPERISKKVLSRQTNYKQQGSTQL